MSILDSISSGGQPEELGEYGLAECEFASQYPGIFEFLARQMYQGQERQLARLLVYAEHGKATLCLLERHSAQIGFHVAESLSEALEGLEKRLQQGTMDWRPDKKQKWRNNRS